jgi:hypothetical protein
MPIDHFNLNRDKPTIYRSGDHYAKNLSLEAQSFSYSDIVDPG